MPRFHTYFKDSFVLSAGDIADGFVDAIFSFPLPAQVVENKIHLHDVTMVLQYYDTSLGKYYSLSRGAVLTVSRPFLDGFVYPSAINPVIEGLVFSNGTFFSSLDLLVAGYRRGIDAKLFFGLGDLEQAGFTLGIGDSIIWNIFLTCSEYTREDFFNS